MRCTSITRHLHWNFSCNTSHHITSHSIANAIHSEWITDTTNTQRISYTLHITQQTHSTFFFIIPRRHTFTAFTLLWCATFLFFASHWLDIIYFGQISTHECADMQFSFRFGCQQFPFHLLSPIIIYQINLWNEKLINKFTHGTENCSVSSICLRQRCVSRWNSIVFLRK